MTNCRIKINKYLTGFLTFMLFLYHKLVFAHAVDSHATLTKEGFRTAFNGFVAEYKLHIGGFSAFGVLTGVCAFVVLFMKLGAVADNPLERSKIIKELLVVGICTSVLGAIVTFFTFFYSIFFIS